jgi:hypothetical protein
MAWQELKWILPLLVYVLTFVPWITLIGWAREEGKSSRNKIVL